MRIISLCPSLTELVFDLGAGQELVGRTKFCLHPHGAVDAVEKVGGTKNPKIARIIELAPDLVLLNEEENRREDADALTAAGVRCHVSFPRTPEDTASMVRSIGEAIVRGTAAERIASDIEARLARVRASVRRQVVRWAYLIWREPWMTVNGDTFIHAMLSLAGGVNVFADRPVRYPAIKPADLAAANPDVVFLSSEPFPFREHHAGELSALASLPRDRFVQVDGELLSWHGSRTAAGIDYAERVLNDARTRTNGLAR